MRDRGRIDIHEISLERSKKLYIIEGINTNEKNDLRYRLKYQEIVMSLWNIPGGGAIPNCSTRTAERTICVCGQFLTEGILSWLPKAEHWEYLDGRLVGATHL